MKYTIVTDWVKLLCVGTIFQLKDSATEKDFVLSERVELIRNLKLKNPGFRYCFDVVYENRNFGLLFYQTTGRYRYANKNSILISVNNERLYEKGYALKLRHVIDDLGIQFMKFTEIHLAIDGKGLVREHSKLTHNKKFLRKANVDVNIYYNNRKHEDDGFVIGSRKSDKYITIYWKEKEMEKNYKPYILEYWKMNNLKPTVEERIERIELRINKASLLDSFTEDFELLENADFLASIFKQIGGNYLMFKSIRSKRERSVIDWKCFKTISVIRTTKNNNAAVKQSYMTAIKKLILEYKETGDKKFFVSAKNLALNKNLDALVKRKMPRWLDDA